MTTKKGFTASWKSHFPGPQNPWNLIPCRTSCGFGDRKLLGLFSCHWIVIFVLFLYSTSLYVTPQSGKHDKTVLRNFGVPIDHRKINFPSTSVLVWYYELSGNSNFELRSVDISIQKFDIGSLNFGIPVIVSSTPAISDLWNPKPECRIGNSGQEGGASALRWLPKGRNSKYWLYVIYKRPRASFQWTNRSLGENKLFAIETLPLTVVLPQY